MAFGTVLARHLARLKWSQRSYAKRVGASQSLVARVISGSRRPPLDAAAHWIRTLELPDDAAAELAHLAVQAHGGEQLLELAWTRRMRAADHGQGYVPNRLPGRVRR